SLVLSLQDIAAAALSTLPLHDALPIWSGTSASSCPSSRPPGSSETVLTPRASSRELVFSTPCPASFAMPGNSRKVNQSDESRRRSEEHTSELQSRENLVCRLLLEKKKK